MGIISVENVKAGMILADKVLTPKRMMLLPAGIELTPAHLITFKTWGVTEVNVQGEAGGGDDGGMTPEEKEALNKELCEIFKFNNLEKPFVAKLFAYAFEQAGTNK
jgi:hypothetical protein